MQRRSSRRWLIVVALAVVLVLVIGYIVGGAAAAAGPVSRSGKALNTAVDHNNTMADMFKNDPFKNIDFTSSNPDTAGAKKLLATVNTQIGTWQQMINGDRAALQKARADLSTSALTLPENSTISNRQHRVDAALSAMADAQKGIDLIKKQMAFLDPLIDVIAGFVAVSKAADAQNIAAMQSSLSTTAASLQKTMTLARDASVPAPLMQGLTAIQKLVTDMQSLVTAVQAGNSSAVNAALAAVDADGKALDSVDQAGIDKGEAALFQPLSDDYDRQMKIAAGN